MFKKHIFLFFFSFIGLMGAAQVDTLVRYNNNFEFKDGIYLSFNEFKSNCPFLPVDRILDKKGKRVNKIWNRTRKFYFMDNDTLRFLPLEEVWGYSENGNVYMVKNQRSKRLQIIGAICHIVLIDEEQEFQDQYWQRNRYDVRPVVREVSRQYVIDFESGERKLFDLENFEEILEGDSALYKKFMALKSKKLKQQMKFNFLTRFNESNPIYFPINKCALRVKKVEVEESKITEGE